MNCPKCFHLCHRGVRGLALRINRGMEAMVVEEGYVVREGKIVKAGGE